MTGQHHGKRVLMGEAETTQFGQSLAETLSAGDTLLLSGPLGAGKSALARAVIRALLGTEEDVPSPTYTLVQTYGSPVREVLHADLYRLGDPGEAEELGVLDSDESRIVLIEWPERLGDALPARYLWLAIDIAEEGRARTVEASTRGNGWDDAIAAFHALREAA
ncbi:MAG: tRNA (adenosine(37)-N6)-threonylcarbamoyltransferase complex ATPase subunit type 1 TsaE [Pseudomonadota bacterium]